MSSKRKTQVKGLAQKASGENLVKAGKKVIAAKGQGALARKKDLKATPKSIHKQATAGDKYYTGKKKDYKGKRK